MRLQRLTGLERDKILEEHKETLELIAKLRGILANEGEIYRIVVEELKEIKEKSKRLKVPKGFSVRYVLIHVNGVSEHIEQDECISNIVNFGKFLHQP